MKCLWMMAAGVWLATSLLAVQAKETAGCIAASVGGYTAQDYGCLSRQMGHDPNAVAAEQHNQAAKAAFNKQSPNQKGLATPAATSTRMGNTFGTGLKPQRP